MEGTVSLQIYEKVPEPQGGNLQAAISRWNRKEIWHKQCHCRNTHVCEKSLPFPIAEIFFRYFKSKFWFYLFFLFSGSVTCFTRSGGWESSPLDTGLEQKVSRHADSILGRGLKPWGSGAERGLSLRTKERNIVLAQHKVWSTTLPLHYLSIKAPGRNVHWVIFNKCLLTEWISTETPKSSGSGGLCLAFRLWESDL